ncbi:hypothetical protein FDB15_03960 [Clostridium botulinum]|uniref:hypothetical protein n=1 Tax=unclassified Clostridium TaxID=2614128 RepID=UPI0013C62686|nr:MULTISPECIES: hypothetical protein [unclassified Clostridium]NFH99497.1 hypothetical protein [Clostridium botulinum]NFI62168.1 hypothetical protein [Clostridium botulinum]NFJ42626.1 hypothetical protein [Clostridium botulinum]NFJ46503.1 hypothetical protein [Clostridium botulinum]NFK26455.1 hypothetical protein [Clostridium botulinum]
MIKEIYNIAFKEINTKEELLRENFDFEDLMYFKQLDILKTDIFNKDEREENYKIISMNGDFKCYNNNIEIYLKKLENVNENREVISLDKRYLNNVISDIKELNNSIKDILSTVSNDRVPYLSELRKCIEKTLDISEDIDDISYEISNV